VKTLFPFPSLPLSWLLWSRPDGRRGGAVQAWPESISHVQEAANRLEGKMESSDESAGNVVFNITISAPRPHRPPIEAALATLENSIPVAALKNDWYSFSFLLSVAFSTIGCYSCAPIRSASTLIFQRADIRCGIMFLLESSNSRRTLSQSIEAATLDGRNNPHCPCCDPTNCHPDGSDYGNSCCL